MRGRELLKPLLHLCQTGHPPRGALGLPLEPAEALLMLLIQLHLPQSVRGCTQRHHHLGRLSFPPVDTVVECTAANAPDPLLQPLQSTRLPANQSGAAPTAGTSRSAVTLEELDRGER